MYTRRIYLLGVQICLLLPKVTAVKYQDQKIQDNGFIDTNIYDQYDSIHGTQLQDIDIRTKFKRDVIEISDYTTIDDWQVQNLVLFPGGYKAYNFTTYSTEAYSTIAYISANICKYPDSVDYETALDYLRFYQSFNGGKTFNLMEFEEGYYQSIDFSTDSDSENQTLNVLLYVEFRNNSETSSDDSFSLQFAVSVDDLVFQWDNGTFVSLVDTDDDSAFFESAVFNLTTSSKDEVINGTSGYSINVFKDVESSYFEGLSRSWCAINSATALISEANIETFYSDSVYDFRKNFVVDGLNASTDYIAYITRDIDGTGEGGVVYSKIQFSTEQQGVCELIYGLDFCSDVAYSVPLSSQFIEDGNKTALMELYDSYAEGVYSNFSKAMQQVNCYGDDDTIYSPVLSCSDCYNSYKNWLCAVAVPRCTTVERDEYLLREVGNSRSDYVNNVIKPPNNYYEILPCINLCWGIVRDCPSATFGFSCPSTNETLLESYNYLTDDNYTTCNLVGNTTTVDTSGSLMMNIELKLMIVCLGLVFMVI